MPSKLLLGFNLNVSDFERNVGSLVVQKPVEVARHISGKSSTESWEGWNQVNLEQFPS